MVLMRFGNSIMALDADRGFRRNLGTGKSLSFVRTAPRTQPKGEQSKAGGLSYSPVGNMAANAPLAMVYLLKTELKEIWFAPSIWEDALR